MSVFVLDKHQKPLMPCSEKRARLLLSRGRVRVHKLYPFTIRLVDRTAETSTLQPLALKLDPGSKATGLALVRKDERDGQHVENLFELQHRGAKIRDKLVQRRGFRRRRRTANLRYRAKRFDNRRRPEGWLPPSLQHRVSTTMTWVERLRKLAPITELAMKLVQPSGSFDSACGKEI